MTDTVNQPTAIVGFFIQHTGQIGIDFVYIRPVRNYLFQVMEHLYHLNVGTSVQRTFQRTDSGCNAGISIRASRTGDTYGKCRVVTTSMLCLKHQQQVEHTRFQRSVFFLNHVKEVFGQRQILVRMANVQRTSVYTVTIDAIRIRNDGREL